MFGKVKFDNIQEMAEFLKCFVGSSCTWDGYKNGDKWIVEFTGGF